MKTLDLAKTAKITSPIMASLESSIKNKALSAIATALTANKERIFAANEMDIKNSLIKGVDAPLIKRLKFGEDKLNEMMSTISSLISIPNPVDQTLMARELLEGLKLYKVSCPIGVLGIIFESRPDALVQIATLCLKSGNCLLLKGGSEAIKTNRILYEIIANASIDAGLPKGWIALLETREDVTDMFTLDNYIDMIIPRGSNSFVKYIMDNSNIPVMGHADGICHVYVDSDADLLMAVKISMDSKTQYVAVCNAVETLLVHESVSKEFLPMFYKEAAAFPVEIRGCKRTQKIISCLPAKETDWNTEYLDYIISIKIVDSIKEAIDHINTHGSNHTDSIITANEKNAALFAGKVDSAGVYVNCSTRFADGFKYGLGAEVGVSTSKIHARGPVGMEGLLIYKYKLIGNGHIVGENTSPKLYTHVDISEDCPL